MKIRLQHRFFRVKFAKVLRTPFFYITSPMAVSDYLKVGKPMRFNTLHRKPPLILVLI